LRWEEVISSPPLVFVVRGRSAEAEFSKRSSLSESERANSESEFRFEHKQAFPARTQNAGGFVCGFRFLVLIVWGDTLRTYSFEIEEANRDSRFALSILIAAVACLGSCAPCLFDR
jgi:hypothetical protein